MADTRSGRSQSGRHMTDDHERRRWDRKAGLAPERWTLGGSRQWICSRATGSVLEVGIGSGLNLAHYRDHVGLTAVDRDSQMLSMARRRVDAVRRGSLLHAGAAPPPLAAAGLGPFGCT